MARTAQIDGSNLVVNVIEAPGGFTLAGFTLVASATAQRGDTYDPGTGAFAPSNAPAPVPPIVSMAQARISLYRGLPGRVNILAEVQTVIDAAGGETKLWWDNAGIVERAHPLVAQLGAALSPPLSTSDKDTLFQNAGAIQ